MLTGRLLVAGWLWLAVLGVWIVPLDLSAVATHHVSKSATVTSIVLAAVGVLLTIAWGAVLGHHRAWIWILISAAAGTAVLATWYVGAWLTSTDQNGDIEAGAGLVILSVPTLVAVGLVLSVGGGIGRLWRVLTDRHLHPANLRASRVQVR